MLEPTLQSGSKTPRWNPRSKLGMCLGKSAEHAGDVSLILDLSINFASPQFHVAHDDDFASVLRKRVGILPPSWDKLFKHYDKANEDDLINAPLTAAMHHEGDKVLKVNARFDQDETVIHPNADTSAAANESKDNANLKDNEIAIDLERELTSTFENEYEDNTEKTSQIINDEDEVTTTRTRRKIRKPSRRMNLTSLLLGLISLQFVNEANFEINHHEQISFFKAQLDYGREINKSPDGASNAFQPLAYQADESNNDTLHNGQAMKAEDAGDFKAAMKKEVDDLHEADVLDAMPLENKPKDRKSIKLIWSFKRKRSPIGLLIKHKARLCAHRGMQEKGADCFNAFVPVVNWDAVRFLLTLSTQNGWCACHVDCVLAFSQAECDADICLSLPPSFHVRDGVEGKQHCIELKKNLHGACQASAN